MITGTPCRRCGISVAWIVYPDMPNTLYEISTPGPSGAQYVVTHSLDRCRRPKLSGRAGGGSGAPE